MVTDGDQADSMVMAGSDDDPAVKLKNLEMEVDLIKTSIKRLLLDLRERMSEFQNPLAVPSTLVGSASADGEVDAAKKAALDAKEAALDARETLLDASEEDTEEPAKATPVNLPAASESEIPEKKILDDQVLASLKARMVAAQVAKATEPERPNLQKVYNLFTWTRKAVKKYGQDRLEIMLSSYRVMGYISAKSQDEIREMVRLMPVDLGNIHEVRADEYVSELYELNRILAPNDTTLDRDMIEVLMEQRRQEGPSGVSGEELVHERAPMLEKNPALLKNNGSSPDWMGLDS
ncbi:MAG: hypothetical protein WC342_09225 [Methanoregula sp.]|jgi:hypothetical protein